MPLEPNELTTAIVYQAIRRSRIRQLHHTSIDSTLPGAEGQLPFPERTLNPLSLSHPDVRADKPNTVS